MADDIGGALNRLAEILERLEKSAAEEKKEKEKIRQLRRENPHLPESSLYDILEGKYEEIGREQGFFGKLMASAAPSGKVALGAMGYAKTYQGGKFGKMLERGMGFGELLRQFGSPYAPPGANLYDASGKNISYSSGDLDRLTDEERISLGEYGYQNLTPEQRVALSEEQQPLFDKYMDLLSRRGEKGVTEKRIGKARSELEKVLPLSDVLGEGLNITDAVEAGIPGAEKLASISKARAIVGGLGGALQMGSRFAGGPAAVAYEAAKTIYKTADALYDPARSAAGLGYGFSYDPRSQGFQVSVGRSLKTNLDAFGSFGLSRQQTAAARAAIEGMGAGGPGSERMYDEYYKSMTSVIEDTQLGAQTLAPFYEQFMRQGGTEKEIDGLTKMLRDDLPKAAAASRMSLQGMAEMIQRTTEAASASPLNYRTKTEISQAVTAAQAAGAPPGLAGIAGGTNTLVTAQTAARLGIDYYSAMGEAGQLQVTAAQGIQNMLGDMTGDEFREFRRTNGARVAAVAQMYQLSVDDVQKLYDQGINDFKTSAVLVDEFSDRNLGKEKKQKSVQIGRFGELKTVNKGVSQKVVGKDLDLYKDKGQKVQDLYGTSIESIRKSFEDMGDDDALKKFNADLENLKGEDAKKTWNVLQKATQDIGKESATDQQGSKDGTITLSEEAKKYFKLDWSSGAQNPNSPNNNWNSGGTRVGRP